MFCVNTIYLTEKNVVSMHFALCTMELYLYCQPDVAAGRMGRRLFQKFVRAGRDGRPWRTSVTGRRNGLLKQTARIPHADVFRRPSEWAVRAGRARTSVTGRWVGLLKQTARIPHADCFRSPPERVVGAGRGRTSVTGRWGGLLKQTARIPHADYFTLLPLWPKCVN